MKLRIERDVFAEAVTWAARALPQKPPVPVLAGLRLDADAGTVTLSAFDYETSARVTVAAEVGTPGTVLVPGRMLAEICRALPARPVDIATDGSRVRITCGAVKFVLLTMPLDDYPTLPASPAASGTVDAATFAAAIGQVAVAASRDESLPILTGIKVEVTGTEVTMLATDRYRLAMRTLPWQPTDPDTDAEILVRSRTLTETAKTLTGGDLTIGLGDGLIALDAGQRRTTSLLIDGQYLKVRSLFPKNPTAHAVVEVGPFVEAARRVALVAERNTPVRCVFLANGTLTLSAGSGADAQADETIDATLTGADELVHSYNPGFLLDGLTALTTPYARMDFTKPEKPVVITGQAGPDGDNDGAFQYLLMPVRIPT